MSHLRTVRLVVAAGFASLLIGQAAVAKRGGTEIWFSPRQENVDLTLPAGLRVLFTKFDFANMLRDDAPWQTAASHISTLTIAVHTIEQFNDLASVVAMTRRHGFQVATAGNMVYTDGACEVRGMEGLDRGSGFAHEIVAAVRKWKANGGRLDYIIMDSPLVFGYYASANDCHYSIAEVARRTANTLAEIRKYYPAIKIMDAEGPGRATIAEWLPVLKEWLDDFKTASGVSINAVGLDLHWSDAWHTGYDWIDATRRATSLLHANGVSAGLYINAKDNDVASTREWMNANRSHVEAAAGARMGLDFVYIASWMKVRFPDRNLPENDPDAYSSLVDSAYASFNR